MASHVSPAFTTPVGLHVGLLTASHAPTSRDTLHLSTGVYKADHSSAAEAAAMYYYHHHRAAYGFKPKDQQIKETSSANSVYANNRSSFMIDDILSKSRKISEESPEKVVNERRDCKDQRLPDHIVIDKDRYVIERRGSEDGVDRYPSGYSSHDRYEVVAVRRRSPSPTGSSLQGSARAGFVARVSSTTGSPTSTVGRSVSPTVVVRKRSRSPASSPRSPSHYDHHHSGDRLSGNHYEHRDHHQHSDHLRNGTSEHYGHSSPMSTGRHHHTVHHQHHHHQQQQHQSQLLQTDTRDLPRGRGGAGEVGCKSRSASPPSGGASPHSLALPLPARPTPIHPAAVHASSSALPSAPTVQDIYGSLPRSSGTEHAGALTVPAPVSLPGVPPPPPPSVTHPGTAPAALSMVYDPLAAATLASPYLQSSLGAYPAPPAVYSLPPYTRPEHYAFLARHHPCKYTSYVLMNVQFLAQYLSELLTMFDRRS